MLIATRFGALILTGLLTACAQFPELDATQTPGVATAPFPTLVPLETVLIGDAPLADPGEVDQIAARVSGLQTRAAQLQARRAGQTGALTRRLAKLRQKAAALRAQ